jgi:hypothetical protein
MVVFMAETLALSCFTSCWVLVKLDCKVLKRASQSWLWVRAMMTRELKWGGWGQKKILKNYMYESDKGEEMNPME